MRLDCPMGAPEASAIQLAISPRGRSKALGRYEGALIAVSRSWIEDVGDRCNPPRID